MAKFRPYRGMTEFRIEPVEDRGKEVTGAFIFSPAPVLAAPPRLVIERFDIDRNLLGPNG